MSDGGCTDYRAPAPIPPPSSLSILHASVMIDTANAANPAQNMGDRSRLKCITATDNAHKSKSLFMVQCFYGSSAQAFRWWPCCPCGLCGTRTVKGSASQGCLYIRPTDTFPTGDIQVNHNKSKTSSLSIVPRPALAAGCRSSRPRGRLVRRTSPVPVSCTARRSRCRGIR